MEFEADEDAAGCAEAEEKVEVGVRRVCGWAPWLDTACAVGRYALSVLGYALAGPDPCPCPAPLDAAKDAIGGTSRYSSLATSVEAGGHAYLNLDFRTQYSASLSLCIGDDASA